MLEPFLNTVAVLRPAALLKKRFQYSCFPVNIFKNTYFEKRLQIAVSAGILLEFCNDHFVVCDLHFIFAILQRHNFDFGKTSFILSFYM